MKRQMIQVDLSQGTTKRTIWIDNDPKLKQDGTISLKDVDGRWNVDKIYDIVLDIDQLNSQRGFDNNNYDVHKGLFS